MRCAASLVRLESIDSSWRNGRCNALTLQAVSGSDSWQRQVLTRNQTGLSWPAGGASKACRRKKLERVCRGITVPGHYKVALVAGAQWPCDSRFDGDL